MSNNSNNKNLLSKYYYKISDGKNTNSDTKMKRDIVITSIV